ncbi:MAG: fumarate hydratase [Defluviitaleaceae bacterium]|nr:fumarate hydratase [Defluviitaleaceae bacterium]MCL2239643.1 fumarate hydratase [Defluviitaleaceae bacterium]
MRTLEASRITKAVAELCIAANVHADPGIREAIRRAYARESVCAAKNALDMIVQNMDAAAGEKMPLCQDTGMVVVFMDVGQDLRIIGNVTDAVHAGVAQGTREGFLRASVVRDPHDRVNTQDNTPAVIHYNLVDGDKIKITVMPKGFGSENKSTVKMLLPSDGMEGVVETVLETVRKAGAAPCPPIIVGVGIGGTMEKAALMAKEALSLDINGENADPHWAAMEKSLLEKINALGIGAAGFGGEATALAVRILTYPTHIAGLPVAVNLGCHVSRHKSAVI